MILGTSLLAAVKGMNALVTKTKKYTYSNLASTFILHHQIVYAFNYISFYSWTHNIIVKHCSCLKSSL